MRRSGQLGTVRHDVMKRAVIFHVLKPVVPCHVLPLDVLRGQRLLVHRTEDQLIPALKMHWCEHLFELVLILDVAKASFEAKDGIVHRFVVRGMLVAATSLFLCLVIEVLLLFSKDLIQGS